MEDLEFLENPVIKKSEEIKELETNSEGVVEENEGNINNVKLKHFFIADAFYFLPQLFYAFYVLFLEFKVDPTTISHGLYRYLFWGPFALFQLLGLMGLLYTFKKMKLNVLNRKKKINEWKLLAWFTPLYLIVPSFIFEHLMTSTGKETTLNQEVLMEFLKTMPLAVSIVAIAIVGPIFEEILFRGIPLFYYKKVNIQVKMILSSVMFSLMHIPTDILSFLIYFVLGYLLAWLVKYTDRLEPSIIVHVLNNLFSILPIW